MILKAKQTVWTLAETLPSGRQIMRAGDGFAVQSAVDLRWTVCPTLADAHRVAIGVTDIHECLPLLRRANRHNSVDPITGATSAQIVAVMREMTFTVLAKANAVYDQEEIE